ncbi:MAG: starch-binding protein [Paludibacteraceae bacterium]|nr:starch-binding protein [Paludibacteraceae bacterium]
MKKLFLTLASVVLSFTAFAGTRTIYLDAQKWGPSDAVYGIHVWGGEAAESYAFALVEGTIYKADIRDDATHAIFLRKDPNGIDAENFWAGEWNRSTTTLDTDKDLYIVTSYSGWKSNEDQSQDEYEHGVWTNLRTIYLDASAWNPTPENMDPVVYAVHVWSTAEENGSDAADYWFSNVSGSLFKTYVRGDATNAIFLRKDPAAENVLTDAWAGVWNRAYSAIPSENNRFKVTAWVGGGDENPCIGEWNTYPSLLSYNIYVRNLTGWETFDVFAWGTPNEVLDAWPGKTITDATQQEIDGVIYNVYPYQVYEDVIPEINLIFHNNVGENQPGDYRQLFTITEARDYYFTVTNDAAWEGLVGVKRFRPYIPMEHVYGYQYDTNGPVGTEWPGAELYPNEQGWYEFIVNKGRTVIFNNGTGEGAMQTGDLAYTDADPVADECAVWQGATNVVVGEFTITYMETSNDCNAAVALKYERDVTNGNYGTICLPYSAIKVEGAELFSIAGKDENGIYLDEASELLKGVPYIFLANADQLTVYYWGGQSFEESADHLYTTNGLVGFINDGQEYTVTANAHNYILHNNGLYFVDSEVKIKSNRAYIDWLNVQDAAPSSAPRRRIAVYNMPTGVENLQTDNVQSTKVIENGVLYLLYNGTKYNVQGQIVK